MNVTREPQFIVGARAPLFDRLTEVEDPGVAEGQSYRILDVDRLRESIGKELSHLLNTRSHAKASSAPIASTSVFDYGLPDFSHLSSGSESDLALLSQLLSRKIQQFEPRLEHVRIKLTRGFKDPRSAIGTIEAMLRVGSISEPVSFPLFVDPVAGQTRLE